IRQRRLRLLAAGTTGSVPMARAGRLLARRWPAQPTLRLQRRRVTVGCSFTRCSGRTATGQWGGVAMGDVQEQHDAPVLVYVTAASVQEAEQIAEELVRERLAACANIIPGMTSIYHWKGELQRDKEVVVMLKSRAGRVAQISERVKQLHSYD